MFFREHRRKLLEETQALEAETAKLAEAVVEDVVDEVAADAAPDGEVVAAGETDAAPDGGEETTAV